MVTPLHIHADAFFRPGFRLCRIRPHAPSSLPTKPSSPECAPPRPPKAQIPASVPSITPPLRGSRQGAAEPVGGETAVRLDAAERPRCRTRTGTHAAWLPTRAFGDSPPALHSRESGNPVMVSSSINLPPLEGESANQGRSLQIFRWGERRPFGLTRRRGLVAGQEREPIRHGLQQRLSGTRPRPVIPACPDEHLVGVQDEENGGRGLARASLLQGRCIGVYRVAGGEGFGCHTWRFLAGVHSGGLVALDVDLPCPGQYLRGVPPGLHPRSMSMLT